MSTPKKNSTANARLIAIFRWFSPDNTIDIIDLTLIALGKIGSQSYFIDSQRIAAGKTLYRAFIQRTGDHPFELLQDVTTEQKDANIIVSFRQYNECDKAIPTQILTHLFQMAIPDEVMSILGQLPAHLIDDNPLNQVLTRMGFLISPKPDHYFVIVLPWVALEHNHYRMPAKAQGQLSVPEYLTYIFFDQKLRKYSRNIFFQQNKFLFCGKEQQSRYHIYRQADGEDRYVYYLAVLHTIYFALSVDIVLNVFHIVQLTTNEMSNYHLLRPLAEEVIKDSINHLQPVCTGEIDIPSHDRMLVKHAFRTAGFSVRTHGRRFFLYVDMRPNPA